MVVRLMGIVVLKYLIELFFSSKFLVCVNDIRVIDIINCKNVEK